MENKKVLAYGYFSNLGINTRENAMKHFENFISLNKNWKLEQVYLYTGQQTTNNNIINQIEEKIMKKEVDIVVLLKLKHLGNEKDFFNFVDKALANNVDVISLKDNFNTLDKNCKIQYILARNMFEKTRRKNNKSKNELDK